MARFGRGKTHAPIIRHGRVPAIAGTVFNDACSGSIALTGTSTDSKIVADSPSGTINLLGSGGVPATTAVTTAASTAAPGVPSNLTPALPAGTTTDSLLVAVTYAGGPRTITPPAGWALTLDSGATGAHCNVYTKPAASGETAPVFACSSNSWAIALANLNGANVNTPTEQATRTAAGVATSLTMPSLTPTAANSLYLTAAMYPNAGQAWTTPGSMTENLDAAAPSGLAARLLVASEALTAPGVPSGARTVSCGVSAVSIAGATLLVRSFVTVTEQRSYTDSPAGSLALSGTRIEAKVCADSRTGSLALSGTASDNKVYTDVRPGTLALSGTVTESYTRPIVYTDTPVGALALTGTKLESKSVADARSGTIALAGSAVDSYVKLIIYTDSRTGTIALSGTCTSTHLKSYTDSPTGTLALSGTCTSTHVKFYTDSPIGSITLLGTRSEVSVRTDSPTGLLKLLGTAAESLSRADSPTGTLRLSGTALDANSRTSTATGLIRLSGSAIESASTANNFSDNPVGRITLTGTCVSSLIKVYNDSPTGRLTLNGTCTSAQSYSDSRTGSLALTGTCTSTHAKSYSDNPTGTLALSGTCSSTHTKGFVDTPTGKLALTGTAADSSQRTSAPVGLVKLSGNISAESRQHTNTCAGVLALAGVVSQTIAYVDQQTGRLILSGTATGDHFIAVSDHVDGTLRLSGRVTESWAAQGRTDYSDYPAGIVTLRGRLILPGVRPDDGIGRARVGAFQTGRAVINLTGRLSEPETGRAVVNLTGSLTR